MVHDGKVTKLGKNSDGVNQVSHRIPCQKHPLVDFSSTISPPYTHYTQTFDVKYLITVGDSQVSHERLKNSLHQLFTTLNFQTQRQM
jgi:hypothetical protein